MKALPTHFGTDISGEDDIAKAAGLDWELESHPVYTGEEKEIILPDRKVLVRSDNRAPLGFLSNRYKVVQPSTMVKTFEHVTEAYGFTPTSMGAYNNGQIIWGQADTNQEFKMNGVDEVKGTMYFITSCNGQVSTQIFFSSMRVACMNALHVAVKGADEIYKKAHSSNYVQEEVEAGIESYMKGWKKFEKNVRKLTHATLSSEQVVRYVTDCLYPGLKELPKSAPKRVEAVVKAIHFSEGAELSTAKKKGAVTAWGALNGITYMTTHQGVGRTEENRHKNMLIGGGANLNQRAMNRALELSE